MIRNLCFLLACLLGITAQAQKKKQSLDSAATLPLTADTVLINSDKQIINIDTYARRYNPRKALFYSAILPGAGQAYNGKYWKVPLVYGGFAIGIYSVGFYQDLYVHYKTELFQILNDPVGTKGVSSSGLQQDQLRNIVNKSLRQRNFWMILNGFWYLFQVMDAHVDAHLKEFELNPQLKVQIEPMIENNIMTGKTKGVALTIKF